MRRKLFNLASVSLVLIAGGFFFLQWRSFYRYDLVAYDRVGSLISERGVLCYRLMSPNQGLPMRYYTGKVTGHHVPPFEQSAKRFAGFVWQHCGQVRR